MPAKRLVPAPGDTMKQPLARDQERVDSPRSR